MLKANWFKTPSTTRSQRRDRLGLHLYLAMAAYFGGPRTSHGLSRCDGSADSRGHGGHAMKIYHQVHSPQRPRPFSSKSRPPPSEWKSVLDVFEHALTHELKVTEKIHALVKLATEESRLRHVGSLSAEWFVTEQVEEENR